MNSTTYTKNITKKHNTEFALAKTVAEIPSTTTPSSSRSVRYAQANRNTQKSRKGERPTFATLAKERDSSISSKDTVDWDSFDTDLEVSDESRSAPSSKFDSLKSSYDFSSKVKLQRGEKGNFIREPFSFSDFLSIEEKTATPRNCGGFKQAAGVISQEGSRLNFPDSLTCGSARSNKLHGLRRLC